MEPDPSPIASILAFLDRHPDQAQRHREEAMRRAIKDAGRKGGPRGR
jgi:hypothetical protein